MPTSPSAIRLLGVDFATLRLREAVNAINARPAGAPFAYVAMPNADHLVRLSRDPATIQPLYQGAMLRLLDSRVVARLARLFGLSAPPVVTGSDLTAMLVRGAAAAGERVTVIGLTKEQAQALAARTRLRFWHHCPPVGFEHDPGAFAAAVQFVENHPARLVFLAVGSPRQEMLAQALARRGIATGTGLCIGASLDYL